MNTKFSVSTLASLAFVAALTLGASGAAQAQDDDIYWSIGMSSPGVQIGVSNAPTVYVQAPVYMQPRPVYVVPRPVVYMPPQPVYYGHSGWGHRQHSEHAAYRGHGYNGHGYRGDVRSEHRGNGRGEVRPQGHSEGRSDGRGNGRMAPELTMGRRH